MTFTVHSIFKTIQGEGYWTGATAVFCRFAGCNLWSGREEDRASAICKFCDTEFRHGDKFLNAESLADAIEAEWGDDKSNRRVVFTGGEPGLQLTEELIDVLTKRHFASHVETNGTVKIPSNARWITLSPKAGTELQQLDCNELKVAWPQELELEPLRDRINPTFSYLQPIDGPRLRENTADIIEYVWDHPWWRVGIQTHKVMGVA